MKGLVFVVAVLSCAGIGIPVLSAFAQRAERGDATTTEKLQRIRRGISLYSLAVTAAAGVAFGLSGVVDRLGPRDILPAVFGGTFGLMILVALGAQIAAAPSIRRVRGTTETTAEGLNALVRGLVLSLLPIGILVASGYLATSLVHGNHLLRGLIQAVAFTTFMALAPVIVRFSIRTYHPDQSVRQRLLDICGEHGLQVRDVLLFNGRRQKRANAFFVGILPSRRYVYVSDYLVDNFSGSELDAVMAHEICHGKERHLVWRVAIVDACILLGNVGLSFAFIYAGLASLTYLGQWFERRADAYAARTVGAGAMIAALRKLAQLNDMSAQTASQTHPSIAKRIVRLGGVLEPGETVRPRGWPARSGPLPRMWRVVIPAAWVALVVVNVAQDSGAPGPNYGAFFTAFIVVALTAMFVVPVLAGFGWRWAPLASVAGSIAGLVMAYADLTLRGGTNGGAELLTFAALAAVSTAAALDRRVRSVTIDRLWQHAASTPP